MKKKKIIILIVGIVAISFGLGVSFAFFTFNSNSGKNVGNEVSGSTNKTPETIFKSEELLKPNNTNIYPGHKSIAAIKVTAQGVNDVSYDLIWSGTNTLENYNYTIYKTTTEERPEFKCQVKTKNIENVGNVYYEECTGDLSKLGEAIDSGVIEKSTENISLKLLENQLINATSEGNVVYYYLVLEFPNIDEAQEGQGGKFEGVFNAVKNNNGPDISIIATYIEQDDGTYKESREIPNKASGYGLNTEKSACSNDAVLSWDYNNWSLNVKTLTLGGTSCNLFFSKGTTMNNILNKYNVGTRSDFSIPYTEETTKTVFTTIDDYGTSKYFAGASTDNYVKFGGFYWRIIRLNGDNTTRLIYYGDEEVIDNLDNKEEVLANDYIDNKTTYRVIHMENKFYFAFNGDVKVSSSYTDNAYVGFKYTLGELRGLSSKSNALTKLDSWYESNLKNDYGKYISGNTGFCGDRTPFTDSSGSTSGTGINKDVTYYGSYIRLYRNGENAKKIANLKCLNEGDLYTTTNSKNGNKSLDNPVGLISADEAAFAGLVYGSGTSKQNASCYLNSIMYWTMSPSMFYDAARVIYINHLGNMVDNGVAGTAALKPVINLASNTRFVGTGTWDDPYTVLEF